METLKQIDKDVREIQDSVNLTYFQKYRRALEAYEKLKQEYIKKYHY